MDLKESALLRDAAGHWYYRCKAAAVLHYLSGRNPRRILSVVHSSYYVGFVFPIAAVLQIGGRGFKRRDAQPKNQPGRHGRISNVILTGLCTAELPLLPWNRLADLLVPCLAARAT